MFLVHYLKFSYKYDLLVGNNLPIELKSKIWNIYKKMLSSEIICNFILEKMVRCDECNKVTFPKGLTRADACADGICANWGSCCLKYLCRDGCTFKLSCGHDVKILPYDMQTDKINITCSICNKLETKKLVWWGISIDEWMRKYN